MRPPRLHAVLGAIVVSGTLAGTPPAMGSGVAVVSSADGHLQGITVGDDGVWSVQGAGHAVGSRLTDLVVSPDRTVVHAAVADHPRVLTLELDAWTGELREVGTGPAVNERGGFSRLAMTATGDRLFAVHTAGDAVYVGATGADGLVSFADASIDTAAPVDVAVSRNGQDLYVLSQGGLLAHFRPTGSTWRHQTTVEAIPASPWTPQMALSADSTALYVYGSRPGGVRHISIAADGRPSTTGARVLDTNRVWAFALHPTGSSGYAWVYDRGLFKVDVDRASGALGDPRYQRVVMVAEDQPVMGLDFTSQRLHMAARGHAGVLQVPLSRNGDVQESEAARSAGADLGQVTGWAVAPNQGPSAAFEIGDASGGPVVEFDARASADVDDWVQQYDWRFGDGTAAPDGGRTPTHAYRKAGDFTVSLTVTDGYGCSAISLATGRGLLCHGNAHAVATRTVKVGGPQSTPTAHLKTGLSVRSACVRPTGRRPVALADLFLTTRARVQATLTRAVGRRRVPSGCPRRVPRLRDATWRTVAALRGSEMPSGRHRVLVARPKSKTSDGVVLRGPRLRPGIYRLEVVSRGPDRNFVTVTRRLLVLRPAR